MLMLIGGICRASVSLSPGDARSGLGIGTRMRMRMVMVMGIRSTAMTVLRRQGCWSHTAGGLVPSHDPVDAGLLHPHTVGAFWLFAAAANLASATDNATQGDSGLFDRAGLGCWHLPSCDMRPATWTWELELASERRTQGCCRVATGTLLELR